MKTKSLICALTDEERRTYGIKLAGLLDDIDNVEGEKKKQADHYKDRIGGLQAAADELRRKVSTGQEWREVECQEVLGQPTPDKKQIIRTDTGEVIGCEWMTEADKQGLLALDLIDGEEDADEEDEAEERTEAEVEADVAEGAGDAEPPVTVEPERPGPLAEAREAGKKAHAAGVPLDKCPFSKRRRKEAEAWGQGWLESDADEADAALAGQAAGGTAEPMPEDDPEAPVATEEDY